MCDERRTDEVWPARSGSVGSVTETARLLKEFVPALDGGIGRRFVLGGTQASENKQERYAKKYR